MGPGRYGYKQGHDWRVVGSTGKVERNRCHKCQCIRTRMSNGGWCYCTVGGNEKMQDPGCNALPGAIGVPFVDGELP